MSHSMNIYLGITIGSFVIYWTYLATEFTGIHKKVRGLIIFSCVIRVILSVMGGIVIIMILCLAVYSWITDSWDREGIGLSGLIINLIFALLITIYLIFKTRILFRIFYDNSDNSTLNNTIELQPSTIISSQTICCGILFISIYEMARIIIGTEIALCFVLSIPFLLQIHFHTDTLNWNIFLPFGTLVIYTAYLFTELIGIHKKIRGLIIFSCVIRIILSVLGGIVIIMILCFAVYAWITDSWDREGMLLAGLIINLIFALLIMLYLIFRTRILFRVFYDNSDNSRLNTTIELQPLRPV